MELLLYGLGLTCSLAIALLELVTRTLGIPLCGAGAGEVDEPALHQRVQAGTRAKRVAHGVW